MTRDNDGNTLLHIVSCYDYLDIVKHLICEAHCNPSCENKYDKIPLDYAYSNGHINIIEYLICEAHSNIYSEGQELLQFACRIGNIAIAQYLIKNKHCNPSCENNDGDTPLHIAHRNGYFNIVEYLICEAHCNVNNEGSKILLSACRIGNIAIAQYLIRNKHCNPSCENNDGDTPLHIAHRNGYFNIVEYLICEAHCSVNDEGSKILLSACRIGNITITKYLISEANCNPLYKDYDGDTPLHYACGYGHLNITQYLISEKHCNPSLENEYGSTPLHIACKNGNVTIVQYLLSTGKVDPLAKNKNDKTPVDYANRHHNSYDLLKLFQSFTQCKRDFPVHTYTKLILTGYSGAGKTTISQLILLLANKPSGFFSVLSSGRVTDVECLTAGIIPLHVESKVNELGNMVIYDFAGQQEYYSSHGAVLERIMKNSAAIFVCIVDLSQCMDKISESIHYWISFIENACSSTKGSSHVIIVGSHGDLVKSSRELKEKSLLVQSIAENRVKQLMYRGFLTMDCRESKTKKARYFCSLLSTSQQAILSSQPSMSLYCHVLYVFLRKKLGKTGCTLHELTTALALEKDFSPDSNILIKLLNSLNDKGLILLVQNKENPQSSSVMVEKEDLLREVNGTLFAPKHLKQYRQVASNTGIVPIATLEELFPQYSSEMLVGCLESMELCHPVDLSMLQATNLKPLRHPHHQELTISSSQVLLKSISLVTSPLQVLAGVWGAVTLTSSSAIVFYMFFSFDLHSHLLWPVSISHPPPLYATLKDSVRCGKIESAGRVSLECPL